MLQALRGTSRSIALHWGEACCVRRGGWMRAQLHGVRCGACACTVELVRMVDGGGQFPA